MTHRAPGSMGASSYPSRVFKGHGGAGQMGNVKMTVQNLEVVDVDRENNIVAVKGAVPGASGTYLIIRYACKKELAPREEVPEEQPEEEAVEGVEEATEAAETVKEEAAETKEEAGNKSDDENKG